MEKEIFNSYEPIKPDEAAKERMLANILAGASHMDARVSRSDTDASFGSKRKEIYMKQQRRMRRLQLTAAISLVLIIPAAAAYATNLFGLGNVSIGKFTVEDPLAEVTEREADFISLQGVTDSPEAKACAEWLRFYTEYDKDGSILSEIGNGPTDIDVRYREAYNCYTQEMKDKVDEICEKYQLSILEGCDTADTYEELCSRTGIGDVCNGTSEQTFNSATGGYFYEDGTLHFEGIATVTGPSACTSDYQFCRSVKGSFCSYVINVEDINDYEQWEYTTSNGQTVLLANSDDHALIIADKEESFIVVNILGDMTSGTFDIGHEALESLAEAFDFSAVS